MNKIYRVVWNETTQTWNAVAEFAKAHGKTASSGIGGIVASAGVRFAFTAIMSGLLLASGQVMAAENSGKTLANGKAISAATEGTDYNTCYFDTVSYNVVCGDDTTKALDFIPQTGGQPPKQGKSVSIGQGAQTSGESNVAIGPKTVTANTGSIAIGAAASANHNQSIAMGQEASAKGEADVSIGKSAGDTVSSGGRNISIGESALKGGSGVNNVIAIGSAAGIDSNSSHSVYIGTGATGMDPKNVAIGNLSKTKGGSIAVGDSSNAQGSSSVAIGTSAATTGVAANGVAIGFNSTTSGLSAVAIGGSSSSGKGANASGPASLAIMGTAVASAQRAIAVGELALGSGSYGIAIGGKANAQGTSSIAIGGSQATDKATNATGNYSTAIGYGAKTVNHDTTAVGKSSSANGLRATAFGVDSNADAENALAVGPQTAASAKGAIAVGFATQANGMSSVAVGKEAIATKETSTSLGQNSQATANNAIAIGNKAVAAGTGNIVVGTNAGVYDAAVSAGRTVGADTVYIGADSGRNAYTNERQISIGKGTGNNATGVDNIALGLRSGAFVVGANNVAIGKEAGMGTDAQKLNVTSTVAIGEAAKGSFNNTVAIGKTALAEKESAVAVGTLSKASGDNSVAIGKAANASGSKALALGVDSVAVNENDVALGSGSLTDAHHSGNYTLNSNYTAAGTSSQGTVSVGKVDAATPANNFTRQIQNVSAGVISATSTDAINGSQLYATNSYLLNLGNNVKNALGGETAIDNAGNLTLNNLGGTGKANVHDALEAMNTKINQLGGGSSSHFYSVQTPSNARGNYNNDGATGLDALAAGADAQAAGEFAVAVGTGAQAVISNSIAIGKNATVNEDTTSNMDVNGLTKGEGSVAIGAYTKASGTNATAVGQSSNAYGQNSLAAGQSSKALGKSSVALGDGANATQDSASSLGPYSQATAAGATALGFNTRATAFATVAAGRNSKAVANNAVAVGNEADAQKEDTIAIGYNAQATQNRAVAFGKNAQATAGDTFAFGDSAKASVGNAIAFGKNANAAHAGSIALGANSATEAAVQTTSATVGGLTFGNFAGNAPESTLSIGTAGKERTITNVAAGRISNNSTDAINGSQLYATQNVMNNIGTTAVGVLGGNATIANDGTIKMTNIGGTGASTIEGAISAINNASYKSFKLNTAKTSGTNGEANNHSLKEITNGSTITLEAGKNIVLNQNESTVSINTADAPEFAGKITAKGGLDMSNTKITNLGKGDQPTDAVNLSQLTDAINNVRATTLTTVTNDAPFAYVSDDGRILKRNVTVDGSGVKKVSFVYADDANTSYNGAVTIAALNPTDPQTTVPTQVGNIAAGKGQNDAVNVSQLDKVAKALGTSVNSATGEIAAPKYSVISGSPATSGVADYNDVGTALTALSNAVRAPLTFAGDSGTPSTRQLGSTVTVKGGEADATKLSDSNNIGVVSDDANGTLNVKLAKELQGLNSAHFETDGNVTTINGGNVSLADKDGNIAETTANGITLTPVPSSGKEAVSLTKDGLNNGGNKITKVAKGTDGTDAVNVAQLNEQLAATEKTTTVAAGKNVTVSEKVDGNNTEYTVNADKTTLSQAANGAVKVSEGAKDADGVTDYALDLTDEAKADIAKGVAAKDAVDNKGLTFAADNGTTGAKKLGDSLSVKGDGNILTRADENGIGFSLADTVKIGQDSGKPVSIDGVNGTVSGLSNKALGGADFATKGQAATEEQLNAAQANLANLLGGNAANNNGNVTFTDIGGTGKANVHDAIAAVKETAEKGWNLKANDETSSEKIAAGDTVTFKEGKNIKVSRDGKNITVATSDDVSFNKVTVGDKVALSKDGLKAGDVNITADGIDAGNKAISNVAKGVKATDAVNVAQLNEQLAATEKTTTVVAGKNVTVSEKVDGNNTEYTVNADKTTLSQAANGAVKVSEGAKDADGVTDYALDLTDEAKADIAKGVAAKDAVDNKGLTFAADNGTTGAKKLGDSLNIKGDGNILTRADENGIGFSLADKITVGKAGKGNKPLVIDGTAGLISGLSNTTLGGADFATKGQAASEEQLNATQANLANLLGGNAANDKGNVTTTDIGGTGKDNVHDAIAAVKETADKGWNLNANDETSSEKIGAGDTVTFKEGKNVKVSRNGKNITVATSDDVSFDKVTVGGSVLTDNGLTVGNGKAGKPVSLTKDGLNNGGNKVSDIAAGEADTDAVNVAQLKAA
uniref:ESPR-type extended signal peptide-containing protein n=1 Tax=Neisseria mucosa TaxID=488 RepID=UPI0027E16423